MGYHNFVVGPPFRRLVKNSLFSTRRHALVLLLCSDLVGRSGSRRDKLAEGRFTTTARAPLEVLNQIVSTEVLDSVLGQFEQLAGGQLKSQNARSAYLHYDSWFGAKREGQEDPHWIRIVGGLPCDPRGVALLDDVLERCPAIAL